MSKRTQDLHSQWRSGRPIFGIFVRLTSEDVLETLGLTSVDFVVLDAEHGSFDRGHLSRCVLAAQAAGVPVLVRLPDADRKAVQHCVAIGAQGVLIPHVESALTIADLARFAKGKAIERAYAGAGRSSLQRTSDWQTFRADVVQSFLFIAQMDEPDCLDEAASIVSIDNIDALFLGTIGFALARPEDGLSSTTPESHLEKICKLAREQDRLLGISLTESIRAQDWHSRGVTMYVVDSDMAILRKGVEQRIQEFRLAASNVGEN
jgi:2-keto-3-deoxy-L-rhamnonate aldolase RhmA